MKLNGNFTVLKDVPWGNSSAVEVFESQLQKGVRVWQSVDKLYGFSFLWPPSGLTSTGGFHAVFDDPFEREPF